MTRVAILLCVVPAIALAQQESQQAMIARSVQVYGAVMENNQPKPVTLSGGIAIDARHVITHSRCCDQTKDGKQKAGIVRFSGGFAGGKVAWNGPGDVVILEVDKDLGAPPLRVVPAKFFQKGQPVFSVSIPQNGPPGSAVPSSAVEIGQPDKMPAPVISVKAASDSVDTGSGLYDACGQVMGINLLVDNGSQFAFAIDVAADGLQKLGIQTSVADSPCSAGGPKESSEDKKSSPDKQKEKQQDKGKKQETTEANWRLPQGGEWVGVAIIVGLIALALRRGKRPAATPPAVATVIPEPPPYVPPVAPKPAPKPALRGVAGQYASVSIPLEGPTVLGRDPHAANLVFTSEADSVSKRHCSLRWDASRSVFVLEDLGSTNGTFLATGERLTPGQPRDLHPGNRFYIGDQRNQFEVTLD